MYEESKYKYNDRSESNNFSRNNFGFKTNKKMDKKEKLKKCLSIHRIITLISQSNMLNTFLFHHFKDNSWI